MKTYKFLTYRKSSCSKIFLIIPFFSIFLGINSCDDFTEIKMPISELNTTAVFEDKNTAYAAIADVYAKMRDNGVLTGKSSGTSREMGLYSDELAWFGNSTASANNFYNNTVLPSSSTVAGWWNFSYSQIYSANCIIDGVALSQSLKQEDKEQLTGEAKFVRALLHFYLLQLYGDIPFVTSTDYEVNSVLSRLSAEKVYQKIVDDLESASALLPTEYANSERVRPTAFVAKALLARVFLYKGDYAEASNSASAVLNNTDIYFLPDNLLDVFLKDSPSTIFQFSPRTATRNTDEGQTFIFNTAPPSIGAVTESLLSSFETGDQRLIAWMRSKTSGGKTYFHPFKYKKMPGNAPQTEYSIVFRLQEMYLIRAEARAQQGELSGAKEDLNVIRHAAGLGNTPAMSQEEIRTAVLQERRVELFTEHGHRFLDLKRAGKLDDYLSYKPAWQTSDRLLPLPQKEVNLNPNLGPQNPGY